MITRSSIDVHISHLQQEAKAAALSGARRGTPSRAPGRATEIEPISESPKAAPSQSAPASGRAEARPDASCPQGTASNDFQGLYLSHLEKENVFLREQNTVLLERVKETNIITAKLQSMLSPFLGLGNRRSSDDDRQEGESGDGRSGV